MGDLPVYLSIDVCPLTNSSIHERSRSCPACPQIDSIDPAFAPATGTPETGGWSTRELRTILRGLDGLKIVSADIVEVAPAYDTNAELTTMAAADVSNPLRILGLRDPYAIAGVVRGAKRHGQDSSR